MADICRELGIERVGADEPPAGLSAEVLDRALAALPETARLCVVLSYQEGLSHGEIAEATGLPLGTVKSHVRRGAQRLQETLAAYRGPDGGSRGDRT